ncbi:MAG: ATP-dependent DNA helicase RecG, partial [Thermodesulfobacteriota bacterium]|nr:ATP-dependent DNA helicase RecG [Thermodesulfobacteriota bacterium]
SILDLLFYFPRDYKDYRATSYISSISINQEITIKGRIIKSELIKARKRIYEVVIDDGTGTFKLVWFNPIYKYLKENFLEDSWVVLSGKVSKSKSSKNLQIINPAPENYFILEKEPELDKFSRIHPVYSLTKGLTQNRIQKIINDLLKNINLDALDFFDKDFLEKYKLEKISKSILNIHLPKNDDEICDFLINDSLNSSIWHRSIIFFEFLILCLGMKERSFTKETILGKSHSLKLNNSLQERIMNIFPFQLTESQQKVLSEIINDMKSKKQMNRLLQGDVSSGKTIIALLSMAISYDNNYQSAIIAPTETLADQHYYFLKEYIDEESLVILKSSLSLNEKEKAYEDIRSGKAKVIVGTHSLFQEKVQYKNLSLIVIDEQHRFGVLQRKLMTEKGDNPDILTMTATPIPRTLSSIFFSEFDVSTIDSLPKGRGKTITTIINKESLEETYTFIEDELNKGRQGFVICPIIKKSKIDEFSNLSDVETTYLDLKNNRFQKFNLEMMNGLISSDKKEKIMRDFKNRKIDLLVSTTVIEVGVDVPNATFMIINNPERFGLAQLHQLRGRIGRGVKDSYMFLNISNQQDSFLERLFIFKEISDGFILSEKDLEIRGPGAFYGAGDEQSGQFWNLHLANLKRDLSILKLAKESADSIEDFSFYNEKKKLIRHIVIKMWGESLELTKII